MDGRSQRWEEHRRARREELVADTLRAIRKHGAGVGMDEIAAQAGTSKTVIYRHFGDRAGLYSAVVDHVHQFILADLNATLEFNDPARLPELVLDLADAYLVLVERDPEIYRYVFTPPAPDTQVDPWGGLPELMGAHLSRIIASELRRQGRDDSCAIIWGNGVIGFLRAASDTWMASGQREPRAEVLRHIAAFLTPVLAPGLLPTASAT